MKLKLYTALFALLALGMYSCKSAGKSYRNGNYEQAIDLAAKKLAKKPNDTELQNIVLESYRYAVEDREAEIRNLSNSNSDLKYERIYEQYLCLQNIYNSIRRAPGVYELVKPTDYSSYLNTFQEQASNARMNRGEQLMQHGDKLSSRDAYYEFQKALALKPGDLAIRQKMDEAYAYAVTNVVVEPMSNLGFQFTSYNYDYANFTNSTLRYLQNNRGNQFVQYVSAAEAMTNRLRADNVVQLRMSDINIGRYRDSREIREVTREVVVKEIVISKDSVRKEYGTVRAKITTITRRLEADALLQASVLNAQSQWLWGDTYRGDYAWEASFSTYTGDERALSETDRKYLDQRESYPPSNNEIVRVIMSEIQQKAQCGINDFFRRVN